MHSNLLPVINPRTGNTFRFDWIHACRNTINEVKSTWQVSSAIAKELQFMIAAGHKEVIIDRIAAESKALNSQIGF